MTDRLPPHSVEDEQGVLGCMLLEPNDCIPECISKLPGAEVFYDLRHQTIYGHMVAAYDAREGVDIIILQRRLKEADELDEVGGISYLSTLSDTVPSAANLPSYLEAVMGLYAQRRAIRIMTECISALYERNGEPNAVLDKMESEIMRLSQIRQAKAEKMAKDYVRNALTEIENTFARQGQLSGIDTGYGDINKLTDGLQPGHMIVVGGRPGSGKSTLFMNIIENIVLVHKIPVGVFSLEMTGEEIFKRAIASQAEINLRDLGNGQANETQLARIVKAAGALGASKLYVDDRSGLSIMQIRSKARHWVQRYGIKVLGLDYLQLANALGTQRKHENRQQEVTEISNGVKTLAKELRIPIIVLSQFNREMDKDKNRKPRMSDCRESGCLSVSTSQVFTASGPRTNANQTLNTYSLNECGKIVARESKNIPRPIKPMVRVALRSGRFIDCTPGHPILTDRGFIPARSITEDHSVAAVRKLPEPRGAIKVPEAKWIGWMLGNGSIQGKSIPSFICSDATVSEHFVAATKEIFGFEPKYRPHSKCSKVWQWDITKHTVRTPGGNVCKNWLMAHDLWGRKAQDKHIPDWLLEKADNASIAALLAGLWETDGTITGNILKYCTTSNKMAWQVLWCLSRLGIYAFIDAGYMSPKANFPIFTIKIANGPDVDLFRKTVPMVGIKAQRLNESKLSVRGTNFGDRLGAWVGDAINHALKVSGLSHKDIGYRPQGKRISQTDLSRIVRHGSAFNHLRRLINPNIYWDQIKSIVRIDDGEVFDREVIGGPHNFVANGIIVHNSIENEADLALLLYQPPERDDDDFNDLITPVNALVGKNRHGRAGHDIEFLFFKEYTKFKPRARVADEDIPQ